MDFSQLKHRIFAIILASLFTFSTSVLAQDLSQEAQRVRSDIRYFLSDEGFSPHIDEDGSICFKQEGKRFWIDVSDDSPFYIRFYKEGFNIDKTDTKIPHVVNSINKNIKAIKCCMYENRVDFAIETFCTSSTEFRSLFYRYLSILNYSYTEFRDNCNDYQAENEAPIEIMLVQVGIIDSNGNIITDFGKTLYSQDTKYISCQINAYAKTTGSYDIYCKFYGANGTLSTGTGSPDGYSWKHTLQMKQGNGTYRLMGWGSNQSGHWPKGNYRIELYCNNNLLATKYFTVN